MRYILIPAASFIAAIALFSREPRISASDRPMAERSPNLESRPSAVSPDTWNPASAATYLDQRATWWMTWSRSQRDHDTFCISCHTAVPYAMARQSLRSPLAEAAPSPAEERILANVTKRVRLWHEVAPFYSDKDRGAYKTVESRGTESVLNALVLASHDAPSGHLSDDTGAAFANMWAEQVVNGPATAPGAPVSRPAASASTAAPAKSNYDTPSASTAPAYADHPDQLGAWRWLRFKNEPWEADDSDFYGAALAAVATGTAPENYRLRPEIQRNLKLLRDYLNRHAASATLMNRVVALWATAKIPGLLDLDQQRALLTDILDRQQSDGGWSLPSLAGDWPRHDNTPQDPQSDGYATGLIVYVLQQFAPARDPAQPRSRFDGEALPATRRKPELAWLDGNLQPHLASAIHWLATHQDPATGYWPSASLNNSDAKHIGPETVRFMNDAATAYAVLALTSLPDASAIRNPR